MASDSFSAHCRQITERFLLTAVVVDDELAVVEAPQAHGGLTPPGHRPMKSSHEPAEQEAPRPRPLNVDPITWSFARQGMVCGVVSPHEETQRTSDLAKAVGRADILILDWRLNRKTGENALPLLERVLMDDQQHRLRLIAFYTGEPDLGEIRDKIMERLTALESPERGVSTRESDSPSIDFGACRIVVYGKVGFHGPGLSAVVAETDLANRLIGDFAGMAQGLLPSLVLTSLAAVRDNVHRVLERFGPDLDPAFLAHRACLPLPADSEQHIVEQIAGELHGIMDDAVGSTSPAGTDPIGLWLAGRFGDGRVSFGANKAMDQSAVLKMLTHGVEDKPGQLRARGKDYRLLSGGFSRGTKERVGQDGELEDGQGRGSEGEDGEELDRRLASAMSFRQVVAGEIRKLGMGTVLRSVGAGGGQILLCVTPKCDSVRLNKPTAFLFVPLSDPRSRTFQLVVPVAGNGYKRMTVSLNPSKWVTETLEPDGVSQCVVASRKGREESFVFKGVEGKRYEWVGELKAPVAQSVAHAVAERMSRVALNKSEWLRRSERRGPSTGKG